LWAVATSMCAPQTLNIPCTDASLSQTSLCLLGISFFFCIWMHSQVTATVFLYKQTQTTSWRW
jgi:hypothetical protein